MFEIIYFDEHGNQQDRQHAEFCAVTYNGNIIEYAFTEDRCIEMISDFQAQLKQRETAYVS